MRRDGFQYYVWQASRCRELASRQPSADVKAHLNDLDKAEDGGFAAYEDGFSLLELTRNHYRKAGLDVRHLDLLIR